MPKPTLSATPFYQSVTLTCLSFLLGASVLLSGCSEPEAPQQAAPQMPPPPVDVATVARQEVSHWKEFTGRIEASKSIVVKPRTSGYVVEVGFEDGARVKQGDLLFQVDYRTIQAEVERLKAEVKRAEAAIELTERDLKRADSLKSTNAISQEQLDNRRTELTQAKAAAESARADLRRTKVLYAITTVKAEFDGKVSDARVKVGSSVVAGQTTLTTLVATDEMHAYFDVDEPTFLRLKAQGFDYENETVLVQMGLANQQDYPFQGKIDFIDNQVDASTGTIRMRAVFDNTDGQLTPGLFARVRLQIGQTTEALVVPEKALATDLSTKYVIVVGENNITSIRPVELGQRKGAYRIIKSGLEGGETIIVSGLQRAFPGAPVTPVWPESEQPDKGASQEVPASDTDAGA